MGWKFSREQRIRAGISLAVVFLLVLATNLVDKNHFRIVKENLSTVYEDRLLAKNYLYKISRQIQLKKEVMHGADTEDMLGLNASINDSIKVLVTKFADTKLTEKESLRFQSLNDNLIALFKFENTVVSNESLIPESPIQNSDKYYAAILEDLDALFKIQLDESNRVISNSNRTIDTSNLIARIEIGVLIALGILIQLLVFVKPME